MPSARVEPDKLVGQSPLERGLMLERALLLDQEEHQLWDQELDLDRRLDQRKGCPKTQTR